MAKPNYAFEKRQRELAKRKKKEEKAQRKTLPGESDGPDEQGSAGDGEKPAGDAASPDTPPAP